MIVKSQVKFSFALIIHECLNKASMGVGRPVLAGVTWETSNINKYTIRTNLGSGCGYGGNVLRNIGSV